MKIVIEHEVTYSDYDREEMTIDGKFAASVGPLCESPEDAIIGRSLLSCGDIADLMKRAYEAGKRGEPFEIEWTGEPYE